VQFAAILFYDGQAFMVPTASEVKAAAQLNGAVVCVEKGTTHERNLTEYFAGRGMSVKPLVIDSATEVADAFFAGRCAAYTSDASQLAAVRLRASGGRTFRILPDRMSKEPLAPVVRSSDMAWLTLVRWVLFSLIAAEENGITRDNVRAMREGAGAAKVRRALGADGELGKALGTDPDWSLRAVQSVGNYGEMFERNLGREPRGRSHPDDSFPTGGQCALLDETDRSLPEPLLAGCNLRGVLDDEISSARGDAVRHGIVTPGSLSAWRFAASIASG